MNAAPHASSPPPCPPAAPGFEKLQRIWDPQIGCWATKILPGEYCVTRNAEAITTVLGSCISACVRDPGAAVGGMNHFMLPEDSSGGSSTWLDEAGGLSTRYGSFAMERLINDLLKLGARHERLEVKIFGGGRVLASMTDVGARNINFVRQFLALERLMIAGEDVGDVFPRRVLYFPQTGLVRVKRLRSLDSQTVGSREQAYMTTLSSTAGGNDVELFD